MARNLRPVGYEDRLSLVEHLTELRTRLIVCILAFGVAFGFAFWQNDLVLDAVNRPLEQSSNKAGKSGDQFEQAQDFNQQEKRFYVAQAEYYRLQAAKATDAQLKAKALELAALAKLTADTAPAASARKPVTLGVGEPFTTTFKVASYAALLVSLPLILYQLYAFVLPAFSPREREVALPLMAMVPVLFIAGVVFSYFVVLPSAINFLQNFNDDSFDILLQARDYYGFSILVMGVMGLLFQIPVGILALTRLDIITVAQLRANRRYAILICAVAAMLLPGTDPVTMLLSMAPLIVLYEGSILLAALVNRRRQRQEALLDASDDEADEDVEAERPLLPVPDDEKISS